MPWAPGTLSYAQFSRPLLMPFPPPAMPFPSSPPVLYLNILYGSNHITSSLKDFPIPEGMTVLPLSTTAEFSGEVCSGAYGVFFCMFAPLPTSIHLLTARTVPPRKLSKTIKTRPVTYWTSPRRCTLCMSHMSFLILEKTAKQSISISQNENWGSELGWGSPKRFAAEPGCGTCPPPPFY